MPTTKTHPLLFEYAIPIRWGDQDAYGHLNNAVYFRIFEEARVQWLTDLGRILDGKGIGPVLAHTEATYLRPITYPATIICRGFADTPGRTSLSIHHELSLTGDELTIYTRGSVRLVWIDQSTGKPVELPDYVRQAVTERR